MFDRRVFREKKLFDRRVLREKYFPFDYELKIIPFGS